VFSSPEDSLTCALSIHGHFHDPGWRRANGQEGIVIKLGIHLGPVIAVNAKDTLDYFGTNVNIAARIQATSNSGGVTSHASLVSLRLSLLNGAINPGSLVIVREILKAATPGAADVAVFSGARATYTIAVRADSSRVVMDNVGTDGVDLLRNFEIIRFADQDVVIAGNRRASGAPLNSDTTPTEGAALTVNTAAIADADGLGAFSFQWQTSTNGGATWADIAGATTAAFTPVQDQVNTQLRVAVRFTDGQGFAGRKCWPRPPTWSVT
jgi:hypothetical protein